MSESENNLTYEKFRQLLAAFGSQSASDSGQPITAEYNFRKAHYFNKAQLGRLNDFAGRAAGFIAAKFTSYYTDKFDAVVSGIDQQYAADYFRTKTDSSDSSFLLVFGPDQKHPAGFVDIPASAAQQWLKQVLGESESKQQAGAELSQLEKSFLLDIISIFVNALAGAEKSLNYKSCGNVTNGRPDLGVKPTEPLCIIGFEVKKAGSNEGFRINIVVVCSNLNAVAQKAEQAESKPTPEFLANVITHHIQDVLLSLTVKFDSTMLTFQDVMTLQPNDVVVLDRKITDQAGVFLSDAKLFGGRLARVGTNKALVISRTTT